MWEVIYRWNNWQRFVVYANAKKPWLVGYVPVVHKVYNRHILCLTRAHYTRVLLLAVEFIQTRTTPYSNSHLPAAILHACPRENPLPCQLVFYHSLLNVP